MDQSNMTPHNPRRKHLARTLAALATLPLILASLVTTAPAQGASDRGLVLHYHLDQATGTTSSTSPGTVATAPWPVTPPGSAARGCPSVAPTATSGCPTT